MARYCSYGQKVQKEKVKIRCAKIQWIHHFLLVLQHLIIQHINSYPQKQSTNLKLIIYILSIYAMLPIIHSGHIKKGSYTSNQKKDLYPW